MHTANNSDATSLCHRLLLFISVLPRIHVSACLYGRSRGWSCSFAAGELSASVCTDRYYQLVVVVYEALVVRTSHPHISPPVTYTNTCPNLSSQV